MEIKELVGLFASQSQEIIIITDSGFTAYQGPLKDATAWYDNAIFELELEDDILVIYI